MHHLIQFSLNNRLLVLGFWGLITVAGIRAMLQLPIDAVPDVTNIQVQVLTNAPGLAPEDVERFITSPVEIALSGMPGVTDLRSVSKFGLSVVTVVFEDHTDIYHARQLVGERLVEAREAVPEQYGTPEMGPISTGLGEIYQFEVRGEGRSPMELRTLLDWTINPRLRAVPGVVEVNAFGGELKTYQVTLNPSKLTAYDLTVGEVQEALIRNNRNAGGGYLTVGGEQYLIQGEGLVASLDDLGACVVRADPHGGAPVLIRDVASVDFAPMIRQGAVTRDGEREAVIGIVMMLMGENSRDVARRVDAAVADMADTLPEGVTIDTFYDRTELVDRTIHTVGKNLLEGGLLVVLVLLLLLGNLRAGLMVASAIPLSMLCAFIAMRALGISGNLMSLGALDFGLIVDGSVVLVEHVIRYLQKQEGGAVDHREKVRAACLEVARPMVFGVGIIMLVYVPILGLTGVEGKMFQPMALTVVFALVGSLLVALTLMPVLASVFLRDVSRTRETPIMRLMERLYAHVPGFCLARPKRVFMTAATVFLLSLGLVPFMGTAFMPQLDEGSIAMQIWRLPSVSLEKSNEISLAAERLLKREFPEVSTVVSRTGRAEIATDPMGVEISDTYVMLNPRKTWRFADKEALIEAMDARLKAAVPGAVFSYSQPIQLRVSELISGVRSDVALKIYGDDLTVLAQTADAAAALLNRVPGAQDVKVEQVTGLPVLRLKLNREALARYGIDADAVLDVVEMMGGKKLGVVLEGARRFDLQVRLDPAYRATPADLGNLLIDAPSMGARRRIPLSELADIRLEEAPAQISRDAVSRRISVEANVRGRDLGSFVAEAQALLGAELRLPDGMHLRWGGQFENLETASRRLALLLPLVLALIFLMLYLAFDGLRPATLIYLNVPPAVTGGIVALYLRGYPLSVSAAVGFIALLGIAVLNGVVLIAGMQRLHAGGLSPAAAAVEGARGRLRPVLMTALVAGLGFVPMALATGAGAEVQRPLATVVIGGLLSATVVTLLVLPALYPWFVARRDGARAQAA